MTDTESSVEAVTAYLSNTLQTYTNINNLMECCTHLIKSVENYSERLLMFLQCLSTCTSETDLQLKHRINCLVDAFELFKSAQDVIQLRFKVQVYEPLKEIVHLLKETQALATQRHKCYNKCFQKIREYDKLKAKRPNNPKIHSLANQCNELSRAASVAHLACVKHYCELEQTRISVFNDVVMNFLHSLIQYHAQCLEAVSSGFSSCGAVNVDHDFQNATSKFVMGNHEVSKEVLYTSDSE
ncbi:hypothetical protein GEMRC1_000748 [Eukaryota sp. GEM-RC1]